MDGALFVRVRKLSPKFQPPHEGPGVQHRGRWELRVVTSPGWVRLLGFRGGFSDHT